jgi:hypothetical protein
MMKKPQLIPPDAYPQMLTRREAAKFSKVLRSKVSEVKAHQIIEDSAPTMLGAVLAYVEELESAGKDRDLISEKAHEIKGIADTAGLPATARIAEGLCRYLEDCENLGATADQAVIALHVSAIGRATRDSDHGTRMSDAVAHELAALSTRKLAESVKGR